MLRSLYRNLRFKGRVEGELDSELRAYVDLLVDEKMRAGLDGPTARRDALLEVGGLEQVKEQVREVQAGRRLWDLAQDIRISARALSQNRSFTGFALLMLMLGIGATTTVFSVFYSVVLKPLPFRDLDRIVEVWETRLDRGWAKSSFAEGNFWDARSLNRSFSEMAAIGWSDATLTGLDRPEHVTRGTVSAGFFRVLGLAPVIGRDFTYSEDRPAENNQVMLLSDRLWKSKFKADPRVAGRSVRLNGGIYTIVGVLPPGQAWLTTVDLFTPMVFRPNGERGSFDLNVIAKLSPGISSAMAQADLNSVAARIASANPRAKGIGMTIGSASDWAASAQTRRSLWMLLGAVALLLLIACVNLANLLLARAAGRVREMAVRSALGASRGRIAALALTESCLLCGAGSALGLLLASASVEALKASASIAIPRLAEVELNGSVLAFTFLVTLATGLLAGLAPALQAPSIAFGSALRESDRNQAGGSLAQARLRDLLVAGEVALSLVLLIGAGLLIRSFAQVSRVERGFEMHRRLFFSVGLPGGMPEPVQWQTTTAYLDRLRTLPYVKSAGVVSSRPFHSGDTGMGFGAPGVERPRGEVPWASWRLASAGYFKTLGIRFIAGRTFLPEEEANPRKDSPVVISRRVAEMIYPGLDPIGRPLTLWKDQSNKPARIVGVVADMRERDLEREPNPVIYLPASRQGRQSWEVVVHTANAPMQGVPAFRSLLSEVNPVLPFYDPSSMEDMIGQSVAPRRLQTMLLGLFSALALLLAVAGVYGVLSYWLNRRTAEMGLRVALGAQPRDILRVAIAQGMKPVVFGIVAGLVGAAAWARYLETLLFEVKPADPFTYAAMAAVVAVIALAACIMPALRAARIDPATALRD